METKIKEVHDYFKNKIINGDYEVAEKGKYTWEILIDGEYKFTLWVSIGFENFSCYKDGYNFIHIEMNLTEKRKAYKDIKRMRKEHDEKVLKVARKQEYEQLRKEFEPTN